MIPFEEYVHARGSGLVHLAYALSGNQRAAEDLVHEVFAKARFSCHPCLQQDSKFITFTSQGKTLAEAKRIAGSLRPGAVAMKPPPFTITLAPPGFAPIVANQSTICLAESRQLNEALKDFPGLCVTLLDEVPVDRRWPTNPMRLTVAGMRAEFSDPIGLTSELRVFLSGGRVLQVRQQPLSRSAELSPDDLVRFAEGIKILDK